MTAEKRRKDADRRRDHGGGRVNGTRAPSLAIAGAAVADRPAAA
jgi:hypothetical protein